MGGGKGILQRIRENDIPEIIFIFGTAEFRKQSIIKALKEKLFENSSYPDIQYFYLSSEKSSETHTIDDVGGYLSMPPLLSGVSLAVINIGEKVHNSIVKIKDVLLNKPPGIYIVFWEPVEKLKGTLYKLAQDTKESLGNAVEIVDATFSKKRDLIDFVHTYCKMNKLEIMPAAVEYLIEISGSDVNVLRQNLMNIFYYLSDRSDKVITEEVINAVIFKSAEQSIFQLGDAIGMKNFARAIEIVNNLIMYGVYPLVLFMYIKNFYKQLFAVLSGNKTITQKMHQFLVSKYSRFARFYKREEFGPVFKILLETDARLKSTDFKPVFLIETMLLNIRKIGQTENSRAL